MATDVANAVGTAMQFRKNPETTYQKQLQTTNFGNGLSNKQNYDASTFAQSLGVLGDALVKEDKANATREMQQLTLSKAKAMVAGQTKEDLADFDKIDALQHSGTGYDLTDNKYAMALLERAMGEQLGMDAQQQYLKDNEGKVPKDVASAVSAYSDVVQSAFKDTLPNIKNEGAFRDGLYSTFYDNTVAIANKARQDIKLDYQTKGWRTVETRFQKLGSNVNSMSHNTFVNNLYSLFKEATSYADNATQAGKLWQGILDNNKDLFKSTSQLQAISQMEFFKGHTVGDEIPMGSMYKNVAKSTVQSLSQTLINKYRKRDGTIDIAKALAEAESKCNDLQKSATMFGSIGLPSSGNTDYDTWIKEAASQYNVPAKYLYGLIKQESSFNPNAVSDKGARGLGQFMPDTASSRGVDVSDPKSSIFGAAEYLKYIHDSNKCSWLEATGYYNCGPDGNLNLAETQKHMKIIGETVDSIPDTPLVPQCKVNYGVQEDTFKENYSKEWQEAVPIIWGMLQSNFNIDYDHAIMSSTYRPGAITINGYPSDHGVKEAIDIDLGQGVYSQEQGDKIAEIFKPYFGQVVWEKDGDPRYGADGDNLHLAKYKGNLKATDNSFDYNATAFDPNLLANVKKEIEQANVDATHIRNMKYAEERDKLDTILYDSSKTFAEKQAAIEAADLPAGEKMRQTATVQNAILKEQARQAKLAKGALTSVDKYWANYEKEIYEKDNQNFSRLQNMENNGEQLTDNDKALLKRIAWRRDGYWSYTTPGYGADLGWQNGVFVGTQKSLPSSVADFSRIESQTSQLLTMNDALKEMRASGSSDDEIKASLKEYCEAHGINYEQALKQLF